MTLPIPDYLKNFRRNKRMVSPPLKPPGMTNEQYFKARGITKDEYRKEILRNNWGVPTYGGMSKAVKIGEIMKKAIKIRRRAKRTYSKWSAATKIQRSMRKAMKHRRVHKMVIPKEKRV